MPQPLESAVVVITDASSGIGRATAQGFASRGATVILAARPEQALEEIAQECRHAGARAVVVPTDVLEEDQVKRLAERTLETFGRIDVWVNSAGISVSGRFEETPSDVYDQVIRTNLMGHIHGARVAIPCFREQGHGVLINIASVASYVGQPYTSAYVTSQHGIRGLGECLRMELMDQGDIHVCTVLPATIDTPLSHHHAANHTGRAPHAMEPVCPAELVAATIVRLAERPQREAFVGNTGRMLSSLHTIAPGVTERLMARMVERKYLQDRSPPVTAGNVRSPRAEWTGTNGHWLGKAPETKWTAVSAGLLLLATLPAAYYIWRRSGNGRNGHHTRYRIPGQQ